MDEFFAQLTAKKESTLYGIVNWQLSYLMKMNEWMSWMEVFALERFILIQDLVSPLCVPLLLDTHTHTPKHTFTCQSPHGVQVSTGHGCTKSEWMKTWACAYVAIYLLRVRTYGECTVHSKTDVRTTSTQHTTNMSIHSTFRAHTRTHRSFSFSCVWFGARKNVGHMHAPHITQQLKWNSTFNRSVAMQMQFMRNFRCFRFRLSLSKTAHRISFMPVAHTYTIRTHLVPIAEPCTGQHSHELNNKLINIPAQC